MIPVKLRRGWAALEQLASCSQQEYVGPKDRRASRAGKYSLTDRATVTRNRSRVGDDGGLNAVSAACKLSGN